MAEPLPARRNRGRSRRPPAYRGRADTCVGPGLSVRTSGRITLTLFDSASGGPGRTLPRQDDVEATAGRTLTMSTSQTGETVRLGAGLSAPSVPSPSTSNLHPRADRAGPAYQEVTHAERTGE